MQIPARVVDHDVYHDAAYNDARVARQIVLQPHTQGHVLDATNSHGLLTIEPRAMPIRRHCRLAAGGAKDISPNQSFHILVSNFFDQQIRLPKCIIIAQSGTPPDAIQAVDFFTQNVFSIETSEVDSNPFNPSANLHSHVSAVHYKSAGEKQSQMSRHTEIQNAYSSRLAQDWRHKANLSNKYPAYLDKFISMLIEFQSKWDGHLGCVSVARHCSELVDEKAKPVYSARVFQRDVKAHVLLAAHSQQSLHCNRQMRALRTKRQSIPPQAIVTALSIIWTARLDRNGNT